jgi:hypothetical protein
MNTFAARRIALSAAASVALVVLTAGPAMAAPGDAIGLSTEPGGSGTVVVSVPLLGTPNVVPGDSGERAISVRNDGESAGTLTATIVNVTLADDTTDPFYADLLINGRPVVDLLGQDTQLLTKDLAVGASVPVSMSYEFPLEATSGIDPDNLLEAHVDIRLTLAGSSDALAATGSDDARFALGGAVVGSVLIAAGISAVAARRRRESWTLRS